MPVYMVELLTKPILTDDREAEVEGFRKYLILVTTVRIALTLLINIMWLNIKSLKKVAISLSLNFINQINKFALREWDSLLKKEISIKPQHTEGMNCKT